MCCHQLSYDSSLFLLSCAKSIKLIQWLWFWLIRANFLLILLLFYNIIHLLLSLFNFSQFNSHVKKKRRDYYSWILQLKYTYTRTFNRITTFIIIIIVLFVCPFEAPKKPKMGSNLHSPSIGCWLLRFKRFASETYAFFVGIVHTHNLKAS